MKVPENITRDKILLKCLRFALEYVYQMRRGDDKSTDSLRIDMSDEEIVKIPIITKQLEDKIHKSEVLFNIRKVKVAESQRKYREKMRQLRNPSRESVFMETLEESIKKRLRGASKK